MLFCVRVQQQNSTGFASTSHSRPCGVSLHHLFNARCQPNSSLHHLLLISSFYTGQNRVCCWLSLIVLWTVKTLCCNVANDYSFYPVLMFLQVFILLCIADWMVYGLWHYGRDPDSFSIPYLTAIGDLLGTSLLSLCFYLLWFINKKDTQVGK